jgi:Alpha/beta hydrolase of unknown function (DUF900)
VARLAFTTRLYLDTTVPYMRKPLICLFTALAPIAMIGCATSHNTPSSQAPQKTAGRTMEIWVDQDGTFYPAGWRKDFLAPERLRARSAYSLSAMAKGNQQKKAKLIAAEKSVTAQYRAFISDKRRLLILIHGYNNNEDEANGAYDRIKEKIALKKGDGVVEFFWDGLTAGGARGGTIWFKATGNSQLVGMRGLRKLLNVTDNKKIVFITHSRGASVVLSALSDPPFNPSFVRDTENSRDFKVYGEPKLHRKNNRISALFLAPAIGEIDFGWPRYNRVDRVRDFDPQLERVHYSVNSKDRVLNKFIGLSKYFNPTDVGLNVGVAQRIDAEDPRFKHKEWDPMKTHAFLTYVENRQFGEMLRDLQIDLRTPASNSSAD